MVKAPNRETEQLLFYIWQLSLADKADESKDKYMRAHVRCMAEAGLGSFDEIEDELDLVMSQFLQAWIVRPPTLPTDLRSLSDKAQRLLQAKPRKERSRGQAPGRADVRKAADGGTVRSGFFDASPQPRTRTVLCGPRLVDSRSRASLCNAIQKKLIAFRVQDVSSRFRRRSQPPPCWLDPEPKTLYIIHREPATEWFFDGTSAPALNDMQTAAVAIALVYLVTSDAGDVAFQYIDVGNPPEEELGSRAASMMVRWCMRVLEHGVAGTNECSVCFESDREGFLCDGCDAPVCNSCVIDLARLEPAADSLPVHCPVCRTGMLTRLPRRVVEKGVDELIVHLFCASNPGIEPTNVNQAVLLELKRVRSAADVLRSDLFHPENKKSFMQTLQKAVASGVNRAWLTQGINRPLVQGKQQSSGAHTFTAISSKLLNFVVAPNKQVTFQLELKDMSSFDSESCRIIGADGPLLSAGRNV